MLILFGTGHGTTMSVPKQKWDVSQAVTDLQELVDMSAGLIGTAEPVLVFQPDSVLAQTFHSLTRLMLFVACRRGAASLIPFVGFLFSPDLRQGADREGARRGSHLEPWVRPSAGRACHSRKASGDQTFFGLKQSFPSKPRWVLVKTRCPKMPGFLLVCPCLFDF